MGIDSEQDIDQDYFAGAQVSVSSSCGAPIAPAINIDTQAVTKLALFQLRTQFPTLCYDEHSAIIICDFDMQDVPIIYTSPAFTDLTGYAPTEVLGTNCRFLQRPNDLTPGHVTGPLPDYNGFDPNQSILKEKVERGETAYITIINYHKDGHAFLNGLAITLVSLNGSWYYIGFASDMSPRLDASRHLTDHEDPDMDQHFSDTFQMVNCRGVSNLENLSNRSCSVVPSPRSPSQLPMALASGDFDQLLNDSLVAPDDSEMLISMLTVIPGYLVFVISPSGGILFLSRNVESSLGYTADHLYGCSFFDIVHSQDLSAFRAELRKLTPSGSCVLICRMSTAEGGFVYMELRLSRVSTTSRPISYIVVSATRIPPAAIRERDLVMETANQRPVLWAKISLSGLILYSTFPLKSLFHATQPLQQPSEAVEVVGLTFQNRLCQKSRKVFDDALVTMSKGSIQSIMVQHCFQRPDGKRLVMTSNVFLAEDNQKTIARVRPSFVLLRLQYARKDRNFTSRTYSRRQSEHSMKLALDITCEYSCVAKPRWQSDCSPVSSTSGAQNQSYHQPVPLSTAEGASLPPLQMGDHHEPDSIMFGFDPPVSPEIPHELVSLLPQDRNFCWQYKVHSLAAANQDLRKELHAILASLRSQRRRKRAKTRDQNCVACGTSDTPEWRKGPSGDRNLCNRCGLKYAKNRTKQAQPSHETDVAPQDDSTGDEGE